MRSSPLMLLVPLVLSLSACQTGKTISEDPSALKSYREDAHQGVFTVRGCVHHPGTFTVNSNQSMTLSDALKRAGGTIPGNSWDSGASLTTIRVLRLSHDAVVEYKLDVRHGTDGRDFLIMPGDQIYVPEVIF